MDKSKFKQQSDYEIWKDLIADIRYSNGTQSTLSKSVLKDLAEAHFDKNLKTSHEDLLKIFNLSKKDLSVVASGDNEDDYYHKREIGVINGVEYTRNHAFVNWGTTIKKEPVVTFYPKSVEQVQSAVNWAREHGRRVRCSGYRHSWTDIYCDANEVMICMIPYDQSKVPHAAPIESELTKIEYLGHGINYNEPGKDNKVLVRVGASVTNELLRKRGIELGFSIPLNVIMEDITMGGSNCTCSHGSGINQKTVCDIVHEIKIVNSHGDVVTYNRTDPLMSDSKFRSAIGSLGLFGVVVELTLVVDKMTVIQLDPHPAPLSLIPRYRKGIEADDPKYKQRVEKFGKMITDNYYNEFFWFPLQDKLWVNCWNEIPMSTDHPEVEDFPLRSEVVGQKIKSYMMELVDDVLFGLLPAKAQAELFGAMAMSTVPQEKVKTYKSNGIHFQRGIHYWRVRNYEIEIPIPSDPEDSTKPDLKIIQRAWWDAIDYVNELADKGDCPLNVALEMRIMNGSNSLMAPQAGNEWTLAIEVLANMFVSKERWDRFAQEMNDLWTQRYPDMRQYKYRLHWGKHFKNIKMINPITGKPVDYIDYARDYGYADVLLQFELHRQEADHLNMFSNRTYDQLLGINHLNARREIDWKSSDHPWYIRWWDKIKSILMRIGRAIRNMLCF